MVGAGCAGVCTALEATDGGARVLCVDRFGGGGATALSGGVVYAAGTEIQRRGGVKDSADNGYRYLKIEVGDVVSDETLRRFCDQSAANLDWLANKGVVFGEEVFPGKAAYPPDGYFLYFSGNEMSEPYASAAYPAQRGHRTFGQGYSGYALFDALKRALLAHPGIELLTHSPVRRLVIDQHSRVIGVEVLALGGVSRWLHRGLERLFTRTPIWNLSRGLPTAVRTCMGWLESLSGRRTLIRANRGVVLATGGFGHNRGMVAHHAPHLSAYTPLASVGSDGSGIGLGQSVGGRTARMDNFDMGRHLAVSEPYVRGLLVNGQGRRFVGEDQYHATVGERILFAQAGVAWVILDHELYEEAKLRSRVRQGKRWAVWLNGILALHMGLKRGD